MAKVCDSTNVWPTILRKRLTYSLSDFDNGRPCSGIPSHIQIYKDKAFALFYDTLRGIIYLFFIPIAWNIHISMSIIQVVGKVCPDEIYNLAAQSHVQVSFDSPEYLEKGIVK